MTTTKTLMFYFKLETSYLRSQECLNKIDDIGEICLGKFASKQVIDIPNGDKIIVIVGDNSSHCTIRTFAETGHLNVDFSFAVMDEAAYRTKFNMDFIVAKLRLMQKSFGAHCTYSKSLFCPITRGDGVWRYFVTSDERLLECDYDELVHHSKSELQDIAIHHSTELGNILHLDDDVMFGESDQIYTDTLLGIGTEHREDYTNKEVLILGGGDGGLIHSLVNENVKKVTMVEIDEEVIKVCRTHMRSKCGDTMDKFIGPNHEIIIDDCLKKLLEYRDSGKKFHFVINDLTEFPVEKGIQQSYIFDFKTNSTIMELALNVLKPGGKYLARGNCLSGREYRKVFESDMKKLGCDFMMRQRYVPSFRETYCLYEVVKTSSTDISSNGQI